MLILSGRNENPELIIVCGEKFIKSITCVSPDVTVIDTCFVVVAPCDIPSTLTEICDQDAVSASKATYVPAPRLLTVNDVPERTESTTIPEPTESLYNFSPQFFNRRSPVVERFPS